jgi:predicted flap endonuclease-1-like 5' DNA nuclease
MGSGSGADWTAAGRGARAGPCRCPGDRSCGWGGARGSGGFSHRTGPSPVSAAVSDADLDARLAQAEQRIAAQLEERLSDATARLEARLAHQRSVLEDKEARIAYLSGRVAALEQAPAPVRNPDDLKLISGIGPVLERMLNDVGVMTFDDVAGLSGEKLEEVRALLGIYPDRVEDDGWVDQARALAARRG